MAECGYDAAIIRNNPDLRWLTGAERTFDDETAHTAFITQDGLWLHTDSRYFNTFLTRLGPDTPWHIDMVLALDGGTTDTTTAISTSIALAVPLSVAGLFLTMICRTLAIPIVHAMDAAAEKGNFAAIDRLQIAAILMQGVRIAIPAAALCFISPELVTNALNSMPAWLSGGMAVGGGMVAAVGYAMVVNMMATNEVWPFFVLGFVLAALSQLTLIALGAIGISLALIYLGLKDLAKQGGGAGGGSGDPLGNILDDYE